MPHFTLSLSGSVEKLPERVALDDVVALLDGIVQERTFQAAAARLGLSYRAAWRLLSQIEEGLCQPLVLRTKGHGSALTAYGEALRARLTQTIDHFSPLLAKESAELDHDLSMAVAQISPLRIAMSHDPWLAEILSTMRDVDRLVAGSTLAARSLLDGTADAAGFHFGSTDRSEAGEFAAILQSPEFQVRALFDRGQGLLVATGNPQKVRSIPDLARKGLRFVNRQRGSGTRLWFDQLLEKAGLTGSDIPGYENEEFTHQAVGALVASGEADVGMGVRSVAERFGLGFVPIGRETYFLAWRTDFAHPALDTIVTAVGLTDGRPGYFRPTSGD
ncbi:substrate-binding domain-containing protein [Enterovirga aerilata]|uniref:Helix-turn-helix transcriptional regulator n=1 Tax=Enterovirga aerilata TaxID=2730920 RepID=A0A849HZC6_9HYPH|nr:substrate-binding domain-containing protein [Enterovirga sp. DB1703]NNM72452.1 helix-turn-helix transcriptional regulator [Enterovirga sp. DB1703]